MVWERYLIIADEDEEEIQELIFARPRLGYLDLDSAIMCASANGCDTIITIIE